MRTLIQKVIILNGAILLKQFVSLLIIQSSWNVESVCKMTFRIIFIPDIVWIFMTFFEKVAIKKKDNAYLFSKCAIVFNFHSRKKINNAMESIHNSQQKFWIVKFIFFAVFFNTNVCNDQNNFSALLPYSTKWQRKYNCSVHNTVYNTVLATN